MNYLFLCLNSQSIGVHFLRYSNFRRCIISLTVPNFPAPLAPPPPMRHAVKPSEVASIRSLLINQICYPSVSPPPDLFPSFQLFFLQFFSLCPTLISFISPTLRSSNLFVKALIDQMKMRCSPARCPFRLIAPLFNAIPTFYLILAILLCILSAEADSPDMDEWFARQLRAPKPKFIRFGRAGQKLIRFGRSFSAEPQYSEEGNQLDELVDAVDKLYQFSPGLRAFKTAPKRAQKFIRFG